MSKQIILVFTNAQDGHEDAFNEWYTNTHLGEMVGSVDGWVKAQRFELSGEQLEFAPSNHRYLAIYEIEGDLEQAYAGLNEGMENGSITVLDELVKQDDITAWTYTAITDEVSADTVSPRLSGSG